MRLIKQENLYKKLTKFFEYDFEIAEEGLYVLEIRGRAKNWLQNTLKFISFFQDDDLAVKIDSQEFPKLSGKKGLFDSETSWNGNKLAGLQQVNLFFIYFDQGKHSLHFIIDQSPLLETIKIYQIEDERNIRLAPSQLYQVESGNRRPWLCFVLVDLALEKLKIQASANQNQNGDDNDLQLKINGERQINDTPKSHKYWYWCGRVLKGQSRNFDKTLNLATGLHYIELWADNKPIIDQIEFRLAEQKPVEGEIGHIALYADIDPEINTANLRTQTNETSEILKKIPNQTRVVIIKKAIEDSRPKGYLSDLWHEVFYQGTRGFIHSALIEIRGQERNVIVKTIKSKAKELGIDETLALNLAYCESKWLLFARSETNNKGIYQLGAKTIIDINEKYGGSVSDPYNVYQNIDGGLRYLRFLLKRYVGSSDYLIRVIVAWNVGYPEVPVTGKFDLKVYKDPQTEKLVNCVLKERRGENVLNYLKLLILLLIIGIGLWAFFTSNSYKNLNAGEKYSSLLAQREINYLIEGENFTEINPGKAREKEVVLGYLQTDIDGDQKLERIEFTFYSPEPFVYYTTIYAPDGEKITAYGSLLKTFVDDLTGDGIKELIVQTITGQVSATNLFAYQNGSLEKIPIYDENRTTTQHIGLLTSKEIYFEDLDGDGTKEIILSIRNYGNEFIEPTYYYRWNGRGFMLYDKKDIVYQLSL